MSLYKILLSVLASILLLSCQSTITHLNSKDFDSQFERVAIIGEELTTYSDIIDTEFDLFNVNGFRSQHHAFIDIPGASSWAYKCALKVEQSKIMNWTEGMLEIKADSLDYNPTGWISQITEHRKENWMISSSPRLFTREAQYPNQIVELIMYENEGFIFKSITNN